jgi:Transposase zinc-binding domain
LGHQRSAYNSCGNRHCPKYQSLARAQWLEDRQADVLPVPYFHVVFTLPEKIASIAFQNRRVVYDLLFQATADVKRTKSMVRPIFATLIFDVVLACLNLFGVVVRTASRATMRLAPEDPVKLGGFQKPL